MHRLVMSVLVLTLVLVAALGGAAHAATAADNDVCLSCHGVLSGGAGLSKVDFADSVDYTSCRSCHVFPFDVTTSHEHGAESSPCYYCHYAPPQYPLYKPTVNTPYGMFATGTSLGASASTLHEIHVNSTWVDTEFGDPALGCARCHAPASCSACHSDAAAHGDHALPAYPPVSYRQTTGLRAVIVATTCVNDACHPRATLASSPLPPCANCHADKVDVHGYEIIDHVANDGAIQNIACSACHSLDLASVHGDEGAQGPSCSVCHPTPRDSFAAWDQSCATGGCHTATSTAPMHADTTVAHAVASTNALCLDCHAGTDLESVHVGAVDEVSGRTSCFVCHTGVAGEPVSSDCTVCHFTFADHYGEERHTSSWTLIGCSGTGCHTTRDLMGAHTEKDPTFTCDGCHKDFSVATQIEQGLTGCGDCHTNIYQTSGHRTVHWPTPPLADANGSYYSYYTGSVGTAPTGDCIGCHTSNLVDEHMGITDTETGFYVRMPRKDSTGAALTCDSCHSQPAGSTVQSAIAAGASACESCHQVHGPMQAVHASAFIDNPPVACVDCHDANLAEEHNGGYTSSAGLTGCDVCHALYTGDMAAAVQGAISVTNSTKCDACHAAYHTDSAAHDASSVASLACAGCHDTAATTTIDVTAVHANAAAGPCKVCHDSVRIGEIGGHTAECASCHAAEGTDYHMTMNVHVAPFSSGCQVSGCHHNKVDVRDIHACSTCHADASDPGMTTACSSCHAAQGVDYHYDFDADHTPADSYSTDCARCHGTTDIRVLHETNSCNQCHYINGCSDCHQTHLGGPALLKSTGCQQCHNVEGATGNYHTAMDASHTFGGMSEGCTSCHSQSLPEEHAKYLSRYTEYADSCGLCHENVDATRIDWAAASADCSSCHSIHGDIETIHTASTSDACVRCHDGGDLRYLHGESVDASCATCHNATFSLAGKTAECTSCHTAGGVPFHSTMTTSHTDGTMGADCQTAGCHVKTLPEEHAKYLARYPGYADTCALCHLNADPVRIPAGATAACASCHQVHGDITVIHTATASQACVDCHETAQTLDIHKKTDGTTDCAMCHAAAAGRINWDAVTIECASCHGTLSPVDPNHYPVLNHDATAESACGQCHYKDMKLEHFKPTVAVTCVACHEVKVDSFTAAWDKTCAACHPTKHGDQRTKHASTTTSCGTTEAGCHNIADAEAIHTQPGGPGCRACHKDAATPATTTNCTDAACHANVGTDHRGLHDAAAVNPNGCSGCHFMNLVDEHEALGFTCATCHDNAAYASVIAANDLRCRSCHPDQHKQQDYEFNPGMAGGHRVSADLPGMQSTFNVSGKTLTWTVPTASSFLKTGWTTSSMMGCDSCHSYSGATGPHGATMKVNIDPAYPRPYGTAFLFESGSLGMNADTICAKCHDLNGTSGNFSNKVHDKHARTEDGDRYPSTHRQGPGCITCHVAVPHAWSRPRLIGYQTDPAPYATDQRYGVQAISLRSYTTIQDDNSTGWDKSYCAAECGGETDKHSLSGFSGIAWPASSSAAPLTGAVSGTVSKSTGGALSGATVSIAGKTATTSSTGAYSITGITAGAYTMNVSATGYTPWSGSVTITGNSTSTQNVTLAATNTTQYGSVSGSVKNTSGAAVSGATVSIGGKTATTSSTGTYSITGIATGAYTMSVTATGYTPWSGPVTITANTTTTQNVTLTALAPAATNLARTGTASASSTKSWSYAASKAIDGRADTYWRSNDGGTEWLRIDLGGTKTFDKVVVNWYSDDYARNYRIETSNDGRNWTSRYSTTSGNGGVDTVQFAVVSARYVRVYCTYDNDDDYRILEFEVWGY